MKIIKITKSDPCGCHGYTKMPKDKEHSGKLDTQLFYECPGWPSYQKKNKKKAFNLREYLLKEAQPYEKYPRVCPECHGKKFVYKKLKNLGTLNWDEHKLVSCDTCRGKGYITREDQDSYLHSMGVIPHV